MISGAKSIKYKKMKSECKILIYLLPLSPPSLSLTLPSFIYSSNLVFLDGFLTHICFISSTYQNFIAVSRSLTSFASFLFSLGRTLFYFFRVSQKYSNISFWSSSFSLLVPHFHNPPNQTHVLFLILDIFLSCPKISWFPLAFQNKYKL